MLQLQQLGLHFGFRSRVIWWEDYLHNNFHQSVTIAAIRVKLNCTKPW